MNERRTMRTFRSRLWVVPVVVAVVLFVTSVFVAGTNDLTDPVARRMERRLERRLDALERCMAQVMEQSHASWPSLKRFPDDMVIYRYVEDTLQSWLNEFTTDNDNIRSGMYVQRLPSLRHNQISPLSMVDSSYRYLNMGPKWYLVRSMTDVSGCKVIGGLEVLDTQGQAGWNGVNAHLRLSNRYSLYQISEAGGAPVSVRGVPLLKVVQTNAKVLPIIPNPYVVFIVIFLMSLGILMYVSANHSLRALLAAELVQTASIAMFLALSEGFSSSHELFSSALYAGGGVLSSLGSILMINIWIVAGVLAVYLTRMDLLRFIFAGKSNGRAAAYLGVCLCLIAGICLYGHFTFRSIIMNSNITLELYKISGLSRFTVYVYLSYASLMLALALMLHMMSPVLRRWRGLRYNVLSRTGRLVFSALGAVYFVCMTSVLGFKKECRRAEIVANKLSLDRDLSFELQLMGAETGIASDPVISHLLNTYMDYGLVFRRVSEDYLSRFTGEYGLNMYMFRGDELEDNVKDDLRRRLAEGKRIAADSRFLYSRSVAGRAQYTGLFTFYEQQRGVVNLLLSLESKAGAAKKGYAAIASSNVSADFSTRSSYSHARYLSGRLVSYEGDYAYATVLTDNLLKHYQSIASSGHFRDEDYIHFVRHVSDDEYVVISRPKRSHVRYMVAAFISYLLIYFVLSLVSLTRPRRSPFERNYFRQRINSVLYFSLLGTLVVMALVSVLFVYRRNEANITNLMIGKISTIQSFVTSRARYYDSYRSMTTQDFASFLDEAGSYTSSDISVYTPQGLVFQSTCPDAFERLTLGTRLDSKAFRNIMYRNRRYYIHRERFAGHGMYAMYAPVMNEDGRTIAILNSPYTDEGLAFRDEAVFHAAFIISVFLLLLLFARYLTSAVIDKVFRPLVEMGRKMLSARKGGLQYIYYDRQDEISSLVLTYNRMVHDLSESGKQSAEVERDKAWSQMARQVAHEIKNPLTPIKLQIQRIIRLKQRNAPDWEEKFDAMAPLILESIDVLTDTANEFSTFAKLYTEEPVELDLDEMAADQVALFGEQENLSIQYFGLRKSMVMGPKPQLTRVFVNLLTNAVQAVESMQAECVANGEAPVMGFVYLLVRKSVKDGFYDIVVEDNGPGVKDDDRGRLFTPNFTTKSSGSGLGLAICKNILERCGGEISYSKSFTLGGACFTVRYPMLDGRKDNVSGEEDDGQRA